MTPAALILTSDFELCHMVRVAVERFGIDVGFALRMTDAIKHLEKNKFDLLVIDCSDLEQGCAALRQMRLHRTHRSAVAIAVVTSRAHTKAVSDSGAHFVVERAKCETEISATLRTAYGLVLRERGRYNRFPLDAPVQIRCGEYFTDAQIENISQGGVCIRGVARQLQAPVQLKFALEETSAPLQLTGNPVWQRNERVGIQFTNVPGSSRTELDEWLAGKSEYLAKLPLRLPVGTGGSVDQPDSPDQSRVFGKSGEIRAIVTAIIRGGPVRARCSACKATITFGNTIGAPLDQERKLREAFISHLHDVHPEQLVDSMIESSEASSPHSRVR
jgi:hypothetical protein